MNVRIFLFKLLITFWYVIRLGIILLPVMMVGVYAKKEGWKYGFTYIQGSLEMALFLAFAVSFLLGFYHALCFEIIGKGPIEYFLKSKQKAFVGSGLTIDQLAEKIKTQLNIKEFNPGENQLSFKKRVVFSLPDKVTIKQTEGGYFIESEPFTKYWFIDFGRNFGNIKAITQLAKQPA